QGKPETVPRAGFIKGPVFKGVASSRFLPKGTKTKVNLEEQGRQKVSFSFSLTKKTLPNRFLSGLGNEKQNEAPNPPVPLPADFNPKTKPDLGDAAGSAEESSPPKPKVELGKIHFKKHLLSERVAQNAPEQPEMTPQKEDSHIGKEEEVSDGSKGAQVCSRRQGAKRKFSQSDGAPQGSESDEDSVRTSSSQRSHELKVSSTEKERDSRRSSASLRGDDLGKSSSRSKSDRDEKYSSYSKSDRDSRYSSSRSRSDRDRRRSRSHSRSRSDRSSRTSSSYSRSERSHYYESERRYHRSSPYRERSRYSRSYADRGRESSDSEDEYRRTHSRSSDSRRTSSHSSSSYRDSRSSYSKSDRDSKVESSHADVERRGRSSSKADRDSKRTSESEVSKRCSPLDELGYRKGNSHSKPDSNVNSSRYKSTPSKTPAPKPDKFKSSFCCTESLEEIKPQCNSLDLESSCLKSNEIRVSIAKKLEREKTLSPLNQLSDSPALPKADESTVGLASSKSEEPTGSESHDSVTEPETSFKVKHDPVRTCFPMELSVNGSPEGRGDGLATSSASKAEDVPASSDDGPCQSEVSPVVKTSSSYPLPSNGFEGADVSQEQEPDDSRVQSSECNSLFQEAEAPVLQQQEEPTPFAVVNVDPTKASLEKADEEATPCDKTKEPVFCYISDDAAPALYHSEVEIEAEPAELKVPSEAFLDVQVEPQTVTCDYESVEDPHPKSACEDGHGHPSHKISLAVESSSRDSSQDGCSQRLVSDHPVPEESTSSKWDVPPAGHQELLQHSEAEEVLELGAQHVDLGSAKSKQAFQDEHSYYSEVPLEQRSRQVVEESAVSTEGAELEELRVPCPGILTERDEGNGPLVASAFPDVLRADPCQAQSDGVDSTSQADLTTDSHGKPSVEERMMLTEMVAMGRPVVRPDEQPFCLPESFEGTDVSRHQMSCSKPDRQQGQGGLHQSSLGDYPRLDGFRTTEEMSALGWDFPQTEKPSSTYQQPDSSFGMYSGYVYQPGSGAYGASQNYWQGNGYWDARSASRPSVVNYERIQGQVPDSLTEDPEEYEEDDRWDHPSPSSKSQLPGQKEEGSVQAHEISSNSTKEPLPGVEKKEEVKVLEKNDVKERGPPKKRRPEVESDSESDGDSREKRKGKAEGEPGEPAPQDSSMVGRPCIMDDFRDPQRWKEFAKQGKMPCYFDLIEENVYLTERKKNKSHRDIKRMLCECPPLSKEERAQGEVACGEDCLNRLLMIECSSRCPNGDYCSNRRFQKKQHADVEVILTEKKGWGLRAAKDLPSNTFVLEYCGEVLDHKEFKARVKEYARNKNIHYYFMALKNDEIIDATQKGNCSRFMNHSCEPNCETQKWTVNGQLRVGFFTTKLVPSGSELTFDYQFQRYGKEAQKCFCGSSNCRGYLGGENRVSIRAAGGKMKKERSRKKDSVDGELEALLENGEGLSDKNQVLSLSRLMVRIETLEQKLTCLKLIQNTHSQSCLKSFLECHGLSLLWIWMTELGDGRGSTANNLKLQLEIMKTLELLPIPTKNMLEESKVLPIIQRWAQTKTAVPQLSEGDGYSSENTSRAHTPLNTPDIGAKQSSEGDADTPKKLVFRRLKIISENSMDSAISDTTSELEGKEGKEDADQLEGTPVEAPEEQQQQQQQQEVKAAADAPVESSKAQPVELEAEPEAEAKESNGAKLEEPMAMETPSQDEEEGVSDVESERSQEQTDKIVDVSDLATRLLDSWKELKEVYRIPKKSQAEKESSADRGRDPAGLRDQTPTPKNPPLSRERDPEWQSQSKERKRRRDSLSPPPSGYERGTKRPEDRYDTPASSKKKVRPKDRNKLSTEERRKLFEQEVAQREAQKQQQQLQNLGMASPLPYDSMGYGTPHHSFLGYPPGYPMQAYVDPSNPNAGKVLLPTPSMDSMCSPAGYEHSQTLVGHAVEPALGAAAQPVPVSGQQAVAVQQPYSPAQSQPTIYYQGQTCQTVYGVTSPYSQTTPPIVQSYAQPGLQYIQGQQIYTAHPQGVIVQPPPAVTTIVAAGQPQPIQQPELVVTNNLLDLPPPSPPKPKTIVLPPNWKTARDPEGKIYYYHVVTRQTQWDPPTWDSPGDDAGLEHEAEMDLGTPTYDENPMKVRRHCPGMGGPDGFGSAGGETLLFPSLDSEDVPGPGMGVCGRLGLSGNSRPDSAFPRSQLTHGVMNKELKYCKNPEDLECNENVKHKTKEYIKKYMQKFGILYKPKEDTELE
ncbi:Histone-lysine N-methyltransferase SETD2, partial [Manacus vitellinus]